MKPSGFLIIFVMTLAACAASQSSRPATPWRIELTTTGGLTGRGNGNYAIDSDGNLTLTSMMGKKCELRASAEELERFTTLLRDAKPAEWRKSYAPENRCCDRIEYTLTIDEAGKVTTTEWIDDPLPMPKDLTAIADALTAVRVQHSERCR